MYETFHYFLSKMYINTELLNKSTIMQYCIRLKNDFPAPAQCAKKGYSKF